MRDNSICLAASVVSLALSASTAPACAAKFQVLYNFCSQGTSTNPCTDGSFPRGGLTMDLDGNLLGASGAGGDNGNGLLFELKVKGRKFSYVPLYSLATCDSECKDGAAIQYPLVIDKAGNLYGATGSGGGTGGVAFTLSPNAKRTEWKYQVVYQFCSQGGPACTDGLEPGAGLSYAGASTGALYDGKSALFGTTISGGSADSGALFALTPGKRWSEDVIYSFCIKTNCADGFSPAGALVVAGANSIFGTTAFGGNSLGANGGVLYQVDISAGSEKVLHDFCTDDPCKDGTHPDVIGVAPGAGQTLLGATTTGGTQASGIAYSFDLKRNRESILATFCRKANCSDGATPSGSLVLSGTRISGSRRMAGISAAAFSTASTKKGRKTCSIPSAAPVDASTGNIPPGTSPSTRPETSSV